MSVISFVNIPSHSDTILSLYPPIGVLSMSACLKKHGHMSSYTDADLDRLDPEGVVSSVKISSPQLIGISLTVSQVKHAVPYMRALNAAFPSVPLVVGGPYVSGVHERIFDDFPEISYAVINEGEEAIVELVECLKGKRTLAEVANLLYRKQGQIVCNPARRIRDLDRLPLPDYELIADNLSRYVPPEPSIARPSIAVMCTRGCPYRCSFCSSPRTWGGKITFRSTSSVIEEVMFLKDNFDIKEVFFQDDTLNARPSWFNELCDKIIAQGLHRDLYFKCPFRVNRQLVTQELLQKARMANFWMIFYGVESGSQEMLDRMHKNVKVEEIERAFRMTREAGIYSYASMMIGNYGETRSSVRQSMELLDRIRPDFGGFAVAAPFPGSELYEIAKKKNLLLLDDFRAYQFGDCILRTEALSCEDITHLVDKGNRLFPRYHQFRDELVSDELNLALEADQTNSFRWCAGEHKTVPISVHNRGTEIIVSRPPYPVHVSYHWKRRDGSFEVFEGERTEIQIPILPGDKRDVWAGIKAPSVPGNYVLQITLVQELVSWFEDLADFSPLQWGISVGP